MKRRTSKILAMVMAVVILTGTISLTAWADNNPWQMMMNGETWVDENGQTWMPAPEDSGIQVTSAITGKKEYVWTVKAKTTIYSPGYWDLEAKDGLEAKAQSLPIRSFAAGMAGSVGDIYRHVFPGEGRRVFTAENQNTYFYFVENFGNELIKVTSVVEAVYAS